MRRFASFVLVLLLAGTCRAATAQPAAASHAGAIGTMHGVFEAAGPMGGTVSLALAAPFGNRTLMVTDPKAGGLLAQVRKGDILDFTVNDAANPTELVALLGASRPVDPLPRLAALVASLAGLWLFAALMRLGWPNAFLIGVDNRYSNSQTQLALWFSAVVAVYLATVVLRAIYLGPDYIGGVGIPTNLMWVTGFSAFSFGGAKAITHQKVANAQQRGLASPKPRATAAHFPRDLVQNDQGQADLGDLEMILIALLAVGIFVVTAFFGLGALDIAPHVALPDVDSTLLASFGIGHGAYLAKKTVLNAGDG